ncbi:hypothetical protein VSR68_12370 [Paraburkholderia phymatum]|uniref:hypothetical protein n=1 Tax=Paraburkholderia phymatum TaxID=148447 RepID=UPI003171FB7C
MLLLWSRLFSFGSRVALALLAFDSSKAAVPTTIKQKMNPTLIGRARDDMSLST